MNAATPPWAWQLAIACNVSDVLPLASGTVDLDDASARVSADAESDIEAD